MRTETESPHDERARRWQRGTNQAGMRAQNERLVLSLVRRHGPLAKSEIARMTGLSAQTVSVIMRHLESDRLLRRGRAAARPRRPAARCRCRSTPRAPSSSAPRSGGAASTSCWSTSSAASATGPAPAYRLPHPARDGAAASAPRSATCEALLGERAARIAGLGLAMPFELWSWAEEIGAPEAEMAAWRRTDIRAELAAAAALARSTSRTTPPPPAAPSSPSATTPGCRTSSTSTSAPSSAAASC